MIWKQNENTTAKKRSLFCVCIHTCTLQHNVQARKFKDNGRTEETLQPDVMDSVFATPNKAQSYLQKCGKATLRWVYVCIFFFTFEAGITLIWWRDKSEIRSENIPPRRWERTLHCTPTVPLREDCLRHTIPWKREISFLFILSGSDKARITSPLLLA